jgi:hypothetical protein
MILAILVLFQISKRIRLNSFAGPYQRVFKQNLSYTVYKLAKGVPLMQMIALGRYRTSLGNDKGWAI